MSLPIPKLDDKTWSEIVESARSRIPRVTSDWTDFNVHDPGITFVELFAWLAEIQRFRLDRPPFGATLERFLRLLGLEVERLGPARGWVGFTPPAGTTTAASLARPWVLLESGTRVVRAGRDTVASQVARDTFLTSNTIVRVTSVVGDRRIDRTEVNASPDVPYFAFGETAPVGAALEVELARPFDEPVFELSVDLFENDLPAAGAHLGEPVELRPSAALAWELHDGASWQPLTVLDDGSTSFYRSGLVRFATPRGLAAAAPFPIRARVASGRFEIPPRLRALALNVVEVVQVETEVNEALGESDGRPDQTFRLGVGRADPAVPLTRDHLVERPGARDHVQAGDLLDLDFARALAGTPPADLERLLAALPSALVERDASGTVVGLRALPPESDPMGRERALFDLVSAFDALLSNASWDPSADVRGCAPTGARARARAQLVRLFPRLFASGGLQIEVGRPRTDGTVEWESWERVEDLAASTWRDRHYTLDRIDAAVHFGNGLNGRVPRRGELVRARIYHHSRGSAGNVPPRQSWNVADPAVRLVGTNPLAAAGGRDRESDDDARLRAEQRFHERIRAITKADLERTAKATPGLRVHAAVALPNHDPRLCGIEVPGRVTVVVVPWRRSTDPRAPEPGAGFRETVAAHLERHRLLTTTIRVVGPTIVPFSFSARVFLAPRASGEEVLRRLREVLTRFFDPIGGGPANTGWPLGRSVFPSEIYERLDLDPGVAYATRVRLNALDIDQPLEVPPTGLPILSWEDSVVEQIAGGRP
jgi:hypothetical protein